MKRSSTRSGPSCSGFWDTVRNNLTIREMTALMGGDGTMEQQTEKDVRFENDPQAEVFLLSEKTKEKAPSISAWCSLWCTSRTHIRTFLRFHGFPESDRFRTFLIIKGNEDLIIVEIDGIDEGIHQCLPLLRLGHIQLAETEQPSQSNFLIVCNIVGLHIAKYAGQSSIPNLSLRLNRTNSSFIFGLASRSSAMRACSSFRCSSRASSRSLVELVRMPI